MLPFTPFFFQRKLLLLKRSLLTAAIVPLGLLAAAAQADDETPVPATQDAPKEKTVCRRETPTGSILPKRTCRTVSEWAAVDKQNEATDVRNGRRLDPSLGLGTGGLRSQR